MSFAKALMSAERGEPGERDLLRAPWRETAGPMSNGRELDVVAAEIDIDSLDIAEPPMPRSEMNSRLPLR